ncbi:MAG: biotin--[acetyl-CoA-carboxylase] ligase [Chloroflexi bacterium RBG_13_46_14]|nr:MAG: biotin--[acetyl-CoA-carboxylase] ligase [Chloroflexi bacterium RBG_13_46_14]
MLSAELILDGLDTRMVGQRILYYPSVTSTNEIARLEAGRGIPEGAVVIADEQTAGRGRLKRTWLTPEGNIALSVVLYPEKRILPSLIMIASLAVAHSIETVTGLKTQIKWPNDVLIAGSKVCGILIESDVRKENINYAVIGIGINVNAGRDVLSGMQTPATSLYFEAGKEVSRVQIIRELLKAMDNLYNTVTSGGSVFSEWRDRLVTLGQEVRVTSGEEVFEGIAESVDTDGSLLVRSPDGSLSRVIAGDVTLRRY